MVLTVAEAMANFDTEHNCILSLVGEEVEREAVILD